MPNSSSLYYANINEHTESGWILSICFQNIESKQRSDIKMTSNNYNLDLVNISAYTKAGPTLIILSIDI